MIAAPARASAVSSALAHAPGFRIPFWQRVLAGFVLGARAGWLLDPDAQTWFQPLGDVYVNLIKMIAIPLVFFAVISAVGSLQGQKSIVALGGRTFAWFAVTAVLAVCVGLVVGWVMQPATQATTTIAFAAAGIASMIFAMSSASIGSRPVGGG